MSGQLLQPKLIYEIIPVLINFYEHINIPPTRIDCLRTFTTYNIWGCLGGDDAAVAAVCGTVAGLIQWNIHLLGEAAPEVLDLLVGLAIGIVQGLFWNYKPSNYCLTASALGSMYWFFYGTAFVIGLLEIIAGELITGVTRFIAVSVKTFVLSMGCSFGLRWCLGANVSTIWHTQNSYGCGDWWGGKGKA